MHGTAKQLRKTNLSAVSNGARLFADRLDLRTPRGRRFKDLIASYTQALGARLTEAQRALVRDLALMQVKHEDMQLRFMDTGKLDHTEHSRVVNMMRKHMKTLGLFNAKPNDDPDDEIDPLEYARRGGSRKRSRLQTEDDE